MNKKKILIVLLAVLAIVATTVFVLIQTGKLNLEKVWPDSAKTVELPPPPKYTKTDLPTDKLSDVFSKDLIQEQDPIILENYQSEIEGGWKTEYALKYLTKNSMGENFEAYKKYFSKNHWTLLNEDKKDNFAIIRVTKNVAKSHDSIVVTHTINQTDGMQIVDLALTRSLTERYASTTNPSIK